MTAERSATPISPEPRSGTFVMSGTAGV
jgi:hypothetical protein